MQLHTFFKCLSGYSVFLYFINELTRCTSLNPVFLMLHYLESWSLICSGCIFVNDTRQASRQEFRNLVLASLVMITFCHTCPHKGFSSMGFLFPPLTSVHTGLTLCLLADWQTHVSWVIFVLYFFAIRELTKAVGSGCVFAPSVAIGVGGFALQQCDAYSEW